MLLSTAISLILQAFRFSRTVSSAGASKIVFLLPVGDDGPTPLDGGHTATCFAFAASTAAHTSSTMGDILLWELLGACFDSTSVW